jgi:hypothetical protein
MFWLYGCDADIVLAALASSLLTLFRELVTTLFAHTFVAIALLFVLALTLTFVAWCSYFFTAS